MLRFALFDIVVRADLLNQTVIFKYFVDCFQCVVELFDRVGRHQREADQCIFRRNSRRYDRIYEDTGFEQFFYDQECQVVVADKQRNDRCCGMADFTTHVTESVQCIVSQFPQMLDAFRFAQHDIECCAGCCCSGGSITRTEYIRAGVVAEIVDRLLIRSDETADRSKRLAECTP